MKKKSTIFPDMPPPSAADHEFKSFGAERDCREFLAKNPIAHLVKQRLLVELDRPKGPRGPIKDALVVRLMKLERAELEKRINKHLAQR